MWTTQFTYWIYVLISCAFLSFRNISLLSAMWKWEICVLWLVVFLEVMARPFVCAPMSFLKNDVIVHICYSSFADLIIFPISVGKSRLFIHCVTLYVLLQWFSDFQNLPRSNHNMKNHASHLVRNRSCLPLCTEMSWSWTGSGLERTALWVFTTITRAELSYVLPILFFLDSCQFGARHRF